MVMLEWICMWYAG